MLACCLRTCGLTGEDQNSCPVCSCFVSWVLVMIRVAVFPFYVPLEYWSAWPAKSKQWHGLCRNEVSELCFWREVSGQRCLFGSCNTFRLVSWAAYCFPLCISACEVETTQTVHKMRLENLWPWAVWCKKFRSWWLQRYFQKSLKEAYGKAMACYTSLKLPGW